MKKAKKREVATVYVIQKKGLVGPKRFLGRGGECARLSEANVYNLRPITSFAWEAVPCRLVPLSSRTAKSKKRTR